MTRTKSTLVCALAILSALGTSGSGRAQTSVPAVSRRSPDPVALINARANPQVQQHLTRARAQDLSANDMATFQNNLQTLVNWIGQNPTNDPNQQSIVSDVQTQLNGLTPDQMTTLADNTDVAAFNSAVSALLATHSTPPVLPPTDPPANLSPPQYGICAPTDGPPPIPSDANTMRNLLITIEVLQAVQVAADDLANINIDILGEGTNAVLVAIQIVVDEIVFALNTTQDQLTFCDINVEASQVTSNWQNTIVIDTDLANLGNNVITYFDQIDNQVTAMNTDIDNHLSSVALAANQYSQINSELTSISTNLSNQVTAVDVDINTVAATLDLDVNNRVNSVDADLKNATTAVDTDVDTHLAGLDTDVENRATQIDTESSTYQTIDVRLKIEHVLAEGENVESFQIPQALGGYLETVRAIVSDVISKLLAAGQTVGGATKWLALGDTAKAAKQYKTAYADYAAAYQTAVK